MTVDVNLPAYTTMENMLRLVDLLRRKNNDEKEVKPIFGLADTTYRSTRSSLRKLGVIEESNLDFTELGRHIAYAANDEEKRNIILSIVSGYKPYQAVLDYVSTNGEVETDLNAVIAFWGRSKHGGSERNRKSAANLFGQITEYAGLGSFVKWSYKSPSRIVWSTSLNSTLQHSAIPDMGMRADKDASGLYSRTVANVSERDTAEKSLNDTRGFFRSHISSGLRTPEVPVILIKVDMTDWNEEKVESFFRFAYGQHRIEDT